MPACTASPASVVLLIQPRLFVECPGAKGDDPATGTAGPADGAWSVKRVALSQTGVTVLQSGRRTWPQACAAARRHAATFGNNETSRILWELPADESTAATVRAAADECNARVLPANRSKWDTLMQVLGTFDVPGRSEDYIAGAISGSLFEEGHSTLADFFLLPNCDDDDDEDADAAPSRACPRMRLRLLNDEGDATWMRALLTSEAWSTNIMPMPHITDDAAAADYIRQRPYTQFRDFGVGVWALCVGDSLEPQGTCGLINRPEFAPVLDLGFALLPQATGHGYAYHACRLVLDFAFWVLAEDRIAAVTRATNAAAQKLLTRVGFPAEPTRRGEGWGVEQFWYDVPLAPMVPQAVVPK